ncbi:MAG: glycosyltransferase [Pseudodesulfovibrio sp.]
MSHLLASLPPDVRYRLLVASSGKHHLAETARVAIAAANTAPDQAPALYGLAKSLFSAAWLTDPLDSVLSADLLEFEKQLPTLSPEAVKCVRTAAAMTKSDPRDQMTAKLAQMEQTLSDEAFTALLQREFDLAPSNGHLAWMLYHHALTICDFATALQVATKLRTMKPLIPIAAKLAADAHFLAGNYEQAAAEYQITDQTFPALCLDRHAEALHRRGKKAEALDMFRRVAKETPWAVNATLRLYDLENRRENNSAPLPGSTAILLYSYNNAEKLDLTLASLHESLEEEQSEVLIWVLSNGPEGGTEQVIEKWEKNFNGRFQGVFLPVNIGAPAARNWLAKLPDVATTDFSVYLDDDVRLPADWLSRLGAAVATYPDAALWGCRVVDYERATNLQQVDLNVMDPTQNDTLFTMSEAHLAARDFGQFSYMRPTTSLTGCCHLFRTKDLLAENGFDLRFSPTQYDDLDHDLRLALAEKTAIYQGHLAVEHMKISGRLTPTNTTSAANAAANMHKLKAKHSEADILTIKERALAALETDFVGKLKSLGIDY